MRLLALLFLLSLPAIAQTRSKESDWSRVEALPTGTIVTVKTRGHHQKCIVGVVGGAELSCTGVSPVTFARGDVRSVVIPHRLRSTAIITVVMGAIGVGVGIGLNGALLGGFKTSNTKAALAGAAPFVLVGLPLGFFTDPARTTVYEAH